MRPLTLDRVPPIKLRALHCLLRGPITGAWNSEWRCATGDQEFNTHTVAWLASVGWAVFDQRRTTIRLTQDGRGVLQQMDLAS